MVVVDSSVWIDFFNGGESRARGTLRAMLDDATMDILVPDLVLFEVLRGFRSERDYRQARGLMLSLDQCNLSDTALAQEAAQHYRALRASGYTIRSLIDVLLASFCIRENLTLLHQDADFDIIERVRGLKVWRH